MSLNALRLWGSLFLLPYTPVLLGTHIFFLSSLFYAVPPCHKEWTVPAGSCPLCLSCLAVSDECYFSGSAPSQSFQENCRYDCSQLFGSQLKWKHWSCVYCLQITLGWKELIALRSISDGYADKLPVVISACLVLLQAMLRLQASWYSQPTDLQITSKTVPNKRSH